MKPPLIIVYYQRHYDINQSSLTMLCFVRQ